MVCQNLQFSPDVPEEKLLHGVAEAAKVYYNYTGDASCLNISQSATGNLGMMGWFYQVRRILPLFFILLLGVTPCLVEV